MTGADTGVVRAGESDAEPLSHVIAAAFFDLPPSRWLIADPQARRVIFPPYFRIFVELALAEGQVHTTPDRAAVALWLPAGEAPPGPPPGYAERLAAVTGVWLDRFLIFDDELARRHPRTEPHQHLALIAVRPDRQGAGLGTALLASRHANLDAHGVPAYLEAASPRTREVYLRFGYKDCGPPVALPEGPSMFPMWRPAQVPLASGVSARRRG